MATTSRIVAVTAAFLIAATGAYWYWSPYMAMNSMRSAAQAKDGDAFNQYVDYPMLRENLKGQFGEMMAKELSKQPTGGSDLANAGAALGTMLGLAFVDRFIDAIVRPEFVMRAIADGKLQNPSETGSGGSRSAEKAKDDVKWSVEHKSIDRVIARGIRAGDTPEESLGFVFDRNGFAGWKLTEIRFPAK